MQLSVKQNLSQGETEYLIDRVCTGMPSAAHYNSSLKHRHTMLSEVYVLYHFQIKFIINAFHYLYMMLYKHNRK